MAVYYGERELGRSTNEIAFGKVDLIVPQGPGTNGGASLIEDRLPDGGAAPTPNELNPGTIVLLLPQDQTNKVATTLTLKADPTGGSVTLDQHGLTDLKIYTDAALQEELTLPKTWTNGETSPTTLYMVGSSTSTNLQSSQGTLDLTYKANLAADGGEYSIKDTVGVNLLPVEVKVNSANPPAGTSGAKYENPDRPTKGIADNLFSVWPGEDFTVKVKLPDSFQLPTGLIKWTVAGESIPDNTKEHTFNWNTTGTKHIKISVGESTFNVWVDLPNVGNLSQGDALLAVDPISSSSLALYGAIALTYANQTWPTAVPRLRKDFSVKLVKGVESRWGSC
jgi:hypothetical protein